MAEIKAIIGLSRGRVAYFEPKSNVLLDLANPVAYVYEGTDVSGLKRAIGGTIYLIKGSLTDEQKQEEQAVKSEVVEKEVEVKAETKAVVEEQKAEVPAEEKPKTSKKKNTKKD